MKYEDAAELETVKGWACKTCGKFFGVNEHLARWCCSTDQPCECGGRKKKLYTVCDDCRTRNEAERELRGLENAKTVDYSDPFMLNDRFYSDIDEYLDECECDEIEPEKYAFVPVIEQIVNLKGIDIIETSTEENMPEDWDISNLNGIDEFAAACDNFNAANKDKLSYHEGSKEKFLIRPPK